MQKETEIGIHKNYPRASPGIKESVVVEILDSCVRDLLDMIKSVSLLHPVLMINQDDAWIQDRKYQLSR